MLPESTRLTYLTLLLRLGGVLTGSAFVAMIMPTEWMASARERIGLGVCPRTPVVIPSGASISSSAHAPGD